MIKNSLKNLVIAFLPLIFLQSFLSATDYERRPLSVVIIGGGPSGLATAIEAHRRGAQVLIIEKRTEYTRKQVVFLKPASLELLEKWHVDVPHLMTVPFGEYGLFGFVQIKYLEEGIQEVVNSLGIVKLQGEFKGFVNNEKMVTIATSDGDILLQYDLIVGADGVHSLIRKNLDIECTCFGTATGSWAFVPFSDLSGEMSVSPFEKHEDHFIRKITIPSGSILFWQSYFNSSKHPELLEEPTQAKIAEETHRLGWEKESKIIEAGHAILSKNIPISLQQALSFSNKDRDVILVGDAAASGSFFHGMGVNTALKTAKIAGEFFHQFREDYEGAYITFDEEMKKATDELIEVSRPLLSLE